MIRFLVAVALAGCTAAPTVGEDRAAIIGGTVDTADPSVVLLYAQVPGANGGSLCTAEVISPHVVLTAAHCVSPAEVGTGAVFSVYVGTDFNNATAAQLLAVTETHFDPLFSTQNLEGGHDIGVAILAKPAPVPPLPVNRVALDASFVGKPVRFVGYGLSDAQAQTGAGTKRQTTTTLTDYTALLIHFSDGQHETCNGDSGGPAFMTINGQETIVGLTSYGDVNCAQGGYDTRVDAVIAFADKYVTQLDPIAPSPAPSVDMAPRPTSPDLAQPPAPAPSTPPAPAQPSGSTPTATPPAATPAPPAGSTQPTARAVGAPCGRDSDCASNVCGIGNRGTLVCMAAGSAEVSGLGGCSVGGREDHMAFAFLLTIALLLSRGLRRRD